MIWMIRKVYRHRRIAVRGGRRGAARGDLLGGRGCDEAIGEANLDEGNELCRTGRHFGKTGAIHFG